MKRGKAHPAHQDQALKQSPNPSKPNILLISTPGGGFFKRKNQREKQSKEELKIKSK